MRISDGISAVVFSPVPNTKSVYEKVYLWPVYNAGRINKVDNVHRRIGYGNRYSIPVERDHSFNHSIQNNPYREYTSEGTIDIRRTFTSPRGLFFDVLA